MAERESTALLRLGRRGRLDRCGRLGSLSLGGLYNVPFGDVLRPVAWIGMLCAVVGMSSAAIETGVPAIHANVIGGGMRPR
jgi:hypothetical protein